MPPPSLDVSGQTVSQVQQLMQSSGDDVGQPLEGDLEVAGVTFDRLDGRAPPDVQVGVVDGDVAVEALARAGLGVGGRQALAAVVGRKHGADTGGAAAQERAALDQLHAMPHLGELDGGLRAGHAAADDEHGIEPVGVGQRVGRGAGVAQRRRG